MSAPDEVTPADAPESSEPVRRKPPPGRPFKPGVSGNPGGRPKAARLAMEALEDKTGELMETAIRIALAGNDTMLMFLLPYKLGKPSQRVELTGADGGTVQVSAVREKLVERLTRLLCADAPETEQSNEAINEDSP